MNIYTERWTPEQYREALQVPEGYQLHGVDLAVRKEDGLWRAQVKLCATSLLGDHSSTTLPIWRVQREAGARRPHVPYLLIDSGLTLVYAATEILSLMS